MTANTSVFQQSNAVMRSAGSSSRDELLIRYRRFREIVKKHHSAVLKYIDTDTILSQARRLGLAEGKTLLLDSVDDLNLVFDLSIYTAPIQRPRAIDRYARSVQAKPGTDEALVIEAMQQARFAVLGCLRRHPVAGLIVKDLFRGTECWLVDVSLESSLSDGAMLATRLYSIGGFNMTAGVIVPLDLEFIGQVIADRPQLLRKGSEKAVNDRFFAEAIYRAAVVSGMMEHVAYQDLPETIGRAN